MTTGGAIILSGVISVFIVVSLIMWFAETLGSAISNLFKKKKRVRLYDLEDTLPYQDALGAIPFSDLEMKINELNTNSVKYVMDLNTSMWTPSMIRDMDAPTREFSGIKFQEFKEKLILKKN